jgi:undecaprenyl-diphosphatase
MKEIGKRKITLGLIFIALFAVFTCLVQVVDVKPHGVNGTDIGFSTLNCRFHNLFGVNMPLYVITDWAGLVPIFIVLAFGILGLVQLIKRKSLFKVDVDILILGGYYLVVAILYLVFEMIPINYRPILIDGFMEKSYPSSTTLLVMCVMPTLTEQIGRRCKNRTLRVIVVTLTIAFSVFMVGGRLISGVHWLTDIVGAAIISIGLFELYTGSVLLLKRGG